MDAIEASFSGWTHGSVKSGWISNVCSRCGWWKWQCVPGYPGPYQGKRDKGEMEVACSMHNYRHNVKGTRGTRVQFYLR